MNLKEMELEQQKLKYDLAETKMLIVKLEERIVELEGARTFSGIYFEGAPEYVKDYMKKDDEKDKKVGE